MFIKVCTFLILTFIVVSCGKDKSVSAVKLKLIGGHIVTAGGTSNFNGGILLMGKSEDGKNSFRTGVTDLSQDITLDLAKGRWEFAAVSWSGTNGNLTGDNRCAYTGFIDLKDAEASVSFDLTMARCLTDFNGRQFSHPDYLAASGQFLDFVPIMCFDNSASTGNSLCATNGAATNMTSYRIIYKADQKGSVTGNVAPLYSGCLILKGGSFARIPVTDSGTDTPFNVSVAFYTNANCNGVPDALTEFHDGIKDGLLDMWSQTSAYARTTAFLFLNPGPQFNITSAEPGDFTFPGAVIVGSTLTFPTPNISFSIASIPSNAVAMCFTINSSCAANEWRQLSQTGNLYLPGLVDGTAYTLKLYYKTAAGVVSSSPTSQSFAVDQTPLVAAILNTGFTATISGGISLIWASTDISSFLKWKIDFCSDMSCGNIIRSYEQTDSNIKYKVLSGTQLSGDLSLGLGQQVCVRVTGIDVFYRSTMATLSGSNCVTISN